MVMTKKGHQIFVEKSATPDKILATPMYGTECNQPMLTRNYANTIVQVDHFLNLYY